ncbi:MAG: hypothetical protein NVSMB55_03270 [Mycobacteriales bacterium]
MHRLPLPDPGTPDLRSPWRFLRRVVLLQWRTIAGGALFGILWMGSQALFPFVVGDAIDAGAAAHDLTSLGTWCGLLLGIGVLQALAGLMRHRLAVTNYLVGAYRTQ